MVQMFLKNTLPRLSGLGTRVQKNTAYASLVAGKIIRIRNMQIKLDKIDINCIMTVLILPEKFNEQMCMCS